MQIGGPMRHEMPKTKALFVHNTDAEVEEGGRYAVFEEKRSSTVAGVAYPTKGSRSSLACTRAIDTAVDSFMERPSESDTALYMIGQFMDDGIKKLQEGDKEFKCSVALLYISKGKARVYPAGYSAVIFFEEGAKKNVWYGDGTPIGTGSHDNMQLPEVLSLGKESRFIFIAAADMETVKQAVAYYEESKGEDADGEAAFMADKHCAYVNLYLPERKRDIIGLRGLMG